MRIAGFTFDALLYEGVSTLVYAGVRESDGTAVVAKLVRDAQRSLTQEYRVLQKVSGSRIVVALGLYEGNSGPVLVEHRYGGSLAAALRRGRFTVAETLRVALQMAEALAQLHSARFIHRDIKPANILYDPATETVTLCDFGAAVELPVNARALPVGDLIGTPSYISPEHTGRTSEGCDVRSDLYSLGVTLYELLTATLPFPEKDLLEVVAAHLSKIPESPHQQLPQIPPVVSDIVMKLLAKQVKHRYQSALGLAADLERCLATLEPDGRIASFELGRSDLLRPQFPPQLFGRGDEIRTLKHALARAATGSPTLVLISGREGTGKSELVRALIRDDAADSPLALGGWSAASERPLVGLADALGSLAGQLLVLDEDRLAELRHQLATRIGPVGQVIVDVVPELADVLGPQPPLVELAAAPARARLHHGFRCFASALGDAAPFVLALRGFEHADPASASLVEAILDQATNCRALVVLLADEPEAFGALRSRADAVAIQLGPLRRDAMVAWTAATLDCGAARANELGEVLHVKSAGNPLLFMRLLEHLIDSGVIRRHDGAYTWSNDQVRSAALPPTLGALASQRITELPDDTRRALVAMACSDDPVDAAAVAAMLETDPATATCHLAALTRECLITTEGDGERIAHPVVAETALAALPADELAVMRGRLGAHLLAHSGAAPTGPAALRIAMALSRGTLQLDGGDRIRAAELHAIAADHVMTAAAYQVAETLFTSATGLLAEVPDAPRALAFRVELGRARALMMLGKNAEADALFHRMTRRELDPRELGDAYTSWCDSHSMVMNRARAVEVGLEGMARLGYPVPAEPRPLQPLAAIRLNQRYLNRLTVDDHLRRPDATDPVALSISRLIPSLTLPVSFLGRTGLHVMLAETAVAVILRYGHLPSTATFFAVHGAFLNAIRGDYAAGRKIYEACDAIDKARPFPELAACTYLVFHYMVSPWYGPWSESLAGLARGVRMGIETGDQLFASMCASSSITMLSLTGAPLGRIIAAIEGWGPALRADRGIAANAANVTHIAGKLTRGEPITSDDLDRITRVPLSAGPMRNSTMVNLGLALSVIGHEAQVRAWFDEIRPTFPRVNFCAPHRMTLWLLDALFAAKDARTGQPARRAEAERILATFRQLRRDTQATNNDPAIALIEAELAWVDGDVDRAVGLFTRAAREAREREHAPLLGYASEQRAALLAASGNLDEAALYYREAVLAYRRWGHLTKVLELEQAHPEVRIRELTSGDDLRRAPGRARSVSSLEGTVSGAMTMGGNPTFTINDQMDLATVLTVSQEISTQLSASGVVRAVLTGIAQNAGAERVVFVFRAASGIETVYGEFHRGVYRDVDVAVDRYAALPKSIVRVVRRTGRPLVVADAASDAAYASDPFVVDGRCRSIACIPIRRKGALTGFVLLENRIVVGAFTPQLVSLTQALVAQAAISLDNATLYDDLSTLNRELEARVDERTRALQRAQQQLIESARKAGMADVAIEVLHNIGNALNSVNVSAQLIHSQVAGSKNQTVIRLATLLDEHKHDLVGFFTADPRGEKLAQMVAMLGGALTRERNTMLDELHRLRGNVDSIVTVVRELHATAEDKGIAILEAPHLLLGEATAAIAARSVREQIAISTDCAELPGARVDKHKALDILAGLLANALDALESVPVNNRQLHVRLRGAPEAVMFQISDNGIGISRDNLTRIFHGRFSSKSGRRGANLHKFANSAASIGGSLTAESDGIGCGATFTLLLPNCGTSSSAIAQPT